METEEQIDLIKNFMMDVFKKCERKKIDLSIVFVCCLSELFFVGLNCSPNEDSLNESVKLAWEIAREQFNKQ